MTALAEIEPKKHQLVMDLVKQAGVDVSDWKNFRGGEAKASTNPKYCYEWSFIEPQKVVVLNLWFESMSETDGNIIQQLGLRGRASESASSPSAAIWKKRALKMDEAIQTALIEQLPIRVIVCNGKMRDANDPKAAASQVSKRLLDPSPWAVTLYDFDTGQCTLTRGGKQIIPQEVNDIEFLGFEGEQKRRFILHRRREAKVRNEKIREALRMGSGRLICEVPKCGFDFAERYGSLGVGYAQVHHKEPLSAAPNTGRKVTLKDLAVVCANCHVMIHVGGECRAIETLIP